MNADRITEISKTVEMLKAAWLKHPEWRFGELITNLQDVPSTAVLRILRDDVWEKAFREYAFPPRCRYVIGGGAIPVWNCEGKRDHEGPHQAPDHAWWRL